MKDPTIKKKVEGQSLHIRGRVQVKESRQLIPDLIVSIYSIDLSALRGENRSWFKQVGKKRIVEKVGDDVTSEGGAFSVMVDPERTQIGRSAIGLVVLAPDDDVDSSTDQKLPGRIPVPLYISPTPRVVDRFQTFVIGIPQRKLKAVGYVLPEPPKVGEVLEKAEEHNREIADWLTKNKKVRTEPLSKIKEKTAKAFKNFKPSAIPKSVRKQENYLEKRGDLKEVLKKVRGKTIKMLKKKKILRKRRLKLPSELYKELGLKAGKTVQLSGSQTAKILEDTRPSAEMAIQTAIGSAAQRKKQEQVIIDQLFSCIPKRNG
jgi:hypothetical protein